ncbi:NCS1 family nucleobase:cation symporter-1 [Cellulomonas sp. PhB143]|uniref:NCS1 family nucleobase:cation symporter-1 n=1 Tax=Cellulomonas sp. PhB143 TaxID=2485186 RepID=UPI000F476E2B|nr:NCS1 family nucleobase:cation symporter-1 [Cellulomonas sp. PhB143]ROS73348.1 NCS1 family nucleobase:cation symporter-1 [Cellulomonas sp. PhB143]
MAEVPNPKNATTLPADDLHKEPPASAGPTPWGTTEPAIERAPRGSSPAHPVPAGASPSLYNRDLAPTTREGRTWHAYSIFTLWASDVHSLGNYVFAAGLFALGLGGWQIMLAFLVGSFLLLGLLNLSGFMGQRTGVPFPVMSRIAFGVRGAQVPAIIRGAVAVAWFGIQTYLASVVLRVLLVALAPSLDDLDHNSILGLSTLGWMAFVALWIVQVVIVSYGMEMIRKYEAFAGPVILATMLGLAIWMFSRAGFSIAWSTDGSLTGGEMWVRIFESAALWVVVYGTFVLNFCDFTRGAPSKRSVVKGNVFGIPVNMLFFAAVVVVMSGSQYKINGTIIESPTEIVQQIPNTLILVLACLALMVLTVAVNLMANFVAPTYTLTNLFPRRLNFRKAAIISASIGLVILPWNLYNSPTVVVYFLGGLGALLGPLFGVIVADYWLLRRGRINVLDLYSDDPAADYAYTRGVNWRAIGAGTPAAVLALVIALVPAFEEVSGFSWFVGAIAACGIYLVVADRSPVFRAVDGEPIAVPPLH